MGLLHDDYDQWHDLFEGILYGLYDKPPETVGECPFCDNVGKAAGAIQIAIVSLERTRKAWTDADAVLQATFFDMIQRLLGLYIRFWAVGYNIDVIWRSGTVKVLLDRIIEHFNFKYLHE